MSPSRIKYCVECKYFVRGVGVFWNLIIPPLLQRRSIHVRHSLTQTRDPSFHSHSSQSHVRLSKYENTCNASSSVQREQYKMCLSLTNDLKTTIRLSLSSFMSLKIRRVDLGGIRSLYKAIHQGSANIFRKWPNINYCTPWGPTKRKTRGKYS